MPRTLVAAVLLLLSCPVLAEARGMVYELANPQAPRAEWQRKPLANVYVVITWTVIIPAPAHAISSCQHSEIARSDEKGEYVMEGPGFFSLGGRTSLLVYAPGLQRVDWPWAERPEAIKEISMAKSTLSADERLSRLLVFEYPGCEGKLHDPRGLRKAYFEAILTEAKTLNPTSQAGKNTLLYLEGSAKNRAAMLAPVNADPALMRIEAAPAERDQLPQKATRPGG